MQNSEEFKRLAKIIEYWNDKLEVNTELLVSGLVFECLLIVSSEKEAKEIDKWLHDPVKVLTLDEMTKEENSNILALNLPMFLTPNAVQIMFVEMSGLGMRNSEIGKVQAYEAMLTNGMIKKEYQKQVYMRIQAGKERTL